MPEDPAGIERLAVEYTRVFGAVSPGYSLPAPYESVHRQSDAPAELRAEVARFYLDAGLSPVDSAVPPDHLGIELKFVALLCHIEAGAWRAGAIEDASRLLGREWGFVDNHLVRWAPGYADMVKRRAEHSLYKRAASLTPKVISEHCEFIKRLEPNLMSEHRMRLSGWSA